jgi:hypothetical protein
MKANAKISQKTAPPIGASRSSNTGSNGSAYVWSDEHWRKEVFEHARTIKGQREYRGMSLDELQSLVRKWHMGNSQFMGNRSFDETFARFRASWKKIRQPKGEIIATALERARNATDPKAAMAYDDLALRLLVKLCRELRQHWKGKPFPLDCRTAGRCIDKSHSIALDWLDMLVDDGVLVRVDIGVRKKGQRGTASTYQYVSHSK